MKYVNIENAQHSLNSIAANYPVKADWTGKKYIGIDLDWNYEKGEVNLSMKGYVEKPIKEYQQPPPQKQVNGPKTYTAPIYGESV